MNKFITPFITLAALLWLVFIVGVAHASYPVYADGDLAPLGAPDGLINSADYLIASRIALDLVDPTWLELSHGDIYPPGAPDGVINVQDMLLLLKQTLSPSGNHYVETLDLFVDGPADLSATVNGTTATTIVTVGGYIDPGATVINNPNYIDPEDSGNIVWYFSSSGGIANASLGTADLDTHPVLDTGYDLSGGGLGQLVFDIKVNSLSAGANLYVKIDSGYPALGQVVLAQDVDFTIGSWRRVSFSIADLLADPGPGAGLDLENVANVFVIEVTNGSADFYLDNIFITHACPEVGGCNASIKTKPGTQDSDGDGVNDINDLCPGSPAGSTVNAYGCAIAPQLLTATATASSVQPNPPAGAGPASLAADGNMSTRWSSQSTDPGWITLDLGDTFLLSEVIIHWEAANAATYEIRGSNDNNNWTTLSSESGGTFGDRTDNVSVSGTYQFVRMYGLTRSPDPGNGGAMYGYSIWEMEVYGLPAADEDGDGVDDSIDQCPGTPGGSNVDATGCVIADSDGDGVPDASDLCPGTPAGSTVDASGCIVIIPVNEVSSVNGILAGGSGSSQPGFALYVFDNDPTPPDGTSNCNGGCATSWPPLLVTDGVATGVTDLGTIVRADSSVQATHNGRPLYYYVGDTAAGQTNGENAGGVWHTVSYVQLYTPLFDQTTQLEPVTSFVRNDGVVVTRFGDRGRDRHAKDIGIYGPGNSDHYDHYLAQYWHYRTARVQFEDHVPNGQSLIRATYITENPLGAKEFRVWFYGLTTTGQFHFNPAAVEVDHGTFNDDFVKTSSSGIQYMYTVDITEQWKDVATFNVPLQVGVNMEFEISQFLVNPPAGTRLNYYGTSYVYVIGSPGLAPFEWERGVNNPLGVNDGTPIPAQGLLGGDTTLGYNYSEEPAGRFMQMATNLSHVNAQPFVRGRRVHHTNFVDGSHDERAENPIWSEQVDKAGNHYVNTSCANCHVRNGRALVADVGQTLDKWVFKVGDANGDADPAIGKVLQPNQTGTGAEGTVTLGAWTDLANGLRAPNYIFSNGTPARFSARIAPQLVGIGLLEAVPETEILAWEDPADSNSDGISGRASQVDDPVSGVSRLGRFGYKAATSSVEHQVAAAFNTDIGVMTSVLPIPDCGSLQTTCGTAGQELADDQLADLVKYISLLGVGARRDYDNTAGETLFNSAGCGGCHRDTLTTSDYHPLNELRSQTIHPYTDMLLHDMGAGLADNHGEGSANGAEWRTAPLWGLGHARSVMLGDAKANDSVTLPIDPNDVNRIGYLHDGRARNLTEAILWHGGEAEASKQAFAGMTQSEQAALIAFLKTL